MLIHKNTEYTINKLQHWEGKNSYILGQNIIISFHILIDFPFTTFQGSIFKSYESLVYH